MSKLILVTGANSFIGSWIVKFLLEKGYRVRGTVRSKEKAERVLNGINENDRNRIEFVYVKDLVEDSFDEAVENVDRIIHVASPFHFNVKDPEKDLLLPAINGTLNLFRCAHRFNRNNSKQIDRIVLTSSFASIVDVDKGFRPGYTYTEDDWSPLTYEDGLNAKDDPSIVYRTSKVCAERSAWKYVQEEKPSFTLATICEPMVFGPRVDSFYSFDDLNTSNAIIWSLITSGKDSPVPSARVPFQIDVRDVALVHVAALETNIHRNQRYLISSSSWTHQLILDLIHQSPKISERIKSKTPRGNPGEQLREHYQIDSSKAQKDFQLEFIPLKQTIEDLVEQLDQLDQLMTKS